MDKPSVWRIQIVWFMSDCQSVSFSATLYSFLNPVSFSSLLSVPLAGPFLQTTSIPLPTQLSLLLVPMGSCPAARPGAPSQPMDARLEGVGAESAPLLLGNSRFCGLDNDQAFLLFGLFLRLVSLKKIIIIFYPKSNAKAQNILNFAFIHILSPKFSLLRETKARSFAL